jgi:hypothetical protein
VSTLYEFTTSLDEAAVTALKAAFSSYNLRGMPPETSNVWAATLGLVIPKSLLVDA